MGSIVFRDAGLKVFLTASPEERALRRYKQLKEKGLSVNLAALSAEIAERDRRDTTRVVAPLVAVPDAISRGFDCALHRGGRRAGGLTRARAISRAGASGLSRAPATAVQDGVTGSQRR